MNNKEVVMIFPEPTMGARLFAPELGAFLDEYYRQRGVDVVTNESVAGVERRGEQVMVSTAHDRRWVVDGVVAGLGIEPDVSLARQVDLMVDNGIWVNEFLMAGRPGIYAAGVSQSGTWQTHPGRA